MCAGRYARAVGTGIGAVEALGRLEAAASSGVLAQVCARLGVRLLGVFGSATRGRHDASDLDVAVWFSGPPRLVELVDALVSLTGFDAIDVTVLNDADPVIRAEAMCGPGLFEAEAGAWATAQMAAVVERWDTARIRQLDLRRMAADAGGPPPA